MRGGDDLFPPAAAPPPGAGEGAAALVAVSCCRRSRRLLPEVLLALALAVVTFAGQYAVERHFDSLQVFAQYDVLFNADPNLRLDGFSNGWGFFNRNLLHPNLANFVNPPIRLLEECLRMAGMVGAEPIAVRRQLGLLVSPLAAALNAVALLVLFCRMGIPLPRAGLLALTGALSFSQLIFASIPDHFILSGLLLTLTWLLAHRAVEGRESSWWVWLLLAWAAAGITLTNVAIVGIIYFVCQATGEGRAGATRRTGALVAIALAATWAAHVVLSLAYDPDVKPSDSVVWSAHFLREEIPATLAGFPAAVAASIAPPAPQAVPIQYHWPRGSRYTIQFTLADGPGVLGRESVLGAAALLLVVAGGAVHLRVGGPRRRLALAALAVLGFNALFHAFWGHEYFLYSQHWLTAVLLLMAGTATTRAGSRLGDVMSATLLALPVAVGMSNMLHLQGMLAKLAAFP